jgi:hypothetical protein
MNMAKKSSTASSGELPEGMKSNSAVVREILDAGVTKPAEIESLAKQKYRLVISKPLINQVKMAWKKKQGAGAADGAGVGKVRMKRRGRGRGRAKGGSIVGNGIVASGSKGSLSDLDVAKFALKMGGVDKAVAALQNLIK